MFFVKFVLTDSDSQCLTSSQLDSLAVLLATLSLLTFPLRLSLTRMIIKAVIVATHVTKPMVNTIAEAIAPIDPELPAFNEIRIGDFQVSVNLCDDTLSMHAH